MHNNFKKPVKYHPGEIMIEKIKDALEIGRHLLIKCCRKELK